MNDAECGLTKYCSVSKLIRGGRGCIFDTEEDFGRSMSHVRYEDYIATVRNTGCMLPAQMVAASMKIIQRGEK